MNDEIETEFGTDRRHIFAARRERTRPSLKNNLFAEVSVGVEIVLHTYPR
jgi:hypothetical protein